MSVIMANRMLTVSPRIVAGDSHGNRLAAGFGPPTAAMPGLAQEQADVPLGQPGGRTWVIDLDPALWPVNQQDMVTDVSSGEQWQVTSAQLIQNTRFPVVDHVRVQAHAYAGGEGTKA